METNRLEATASGEKRVAPQRSYGMVECGFHGVTEEWSNEVMKCESNGVAKSSGAVIPANAGISERVLWTIESPVGSEASLYRGCIIIRFEI